MGHWRQAPVVGLLAGLVTAALCACDGTGTSSQEPSSIPSPPQHPAPPLPRIEPADAPVVAQWALLLPDASRVVAAPNGNVVVTGSTDQGSFGAGLISRITSGGQLTSVTALGVGCGLYVTPVDLANDGVLVAQIDPHDCTRVPIGNGVVSSGGALLVLDSADDYVRTITDERVSVASNYVVLPASDGTFLVRFGYIRKITREGATLWTFPGRFYGAIEPLPDGSILAWEDGAVDAPSIRTLTRISADGALMWSMNEPMPVLLGTGPLAVQDAESFVVATRDASEQAPVVLQRMSFAGSATHRADTGTRRLTHLLSLADASVMIAFEMLDSAGRLCARVRLYSPTLERLWEYGVDDECAVRVQDIERGPDGTLFIVGALRGPSSLTAGNPLIPTDGWSGFILSLRAR